jgi:uncharacterized protein YbgA (DUF1722 family)/uncharacterized protein YbbK (DUF523 family)
MEAKVRIGISACLLGEKVRYDGGHKHNRFLTDTLGIIFDFVPICPEVECGLPVPREAMHLEGDPAAPRLVVTSSGTELTAQLLEYCGAKIEKLRREELCGFILKARSPSCGIFGVTVSNRKSAPRSGSGLFAAAVIRELPLLPVENEERLADPALRGNFMERAIAIHNWQQFAKKSPSHGDLVVFHTRHKLQVMAHSILIYREMGRLVATAMGADREQLLMGYGKLLMRALAQQATPRKHVNVLQHVMGYFKKNLSSVEKKAIEATIESYRQGNIPLAAPLALLRQHAETYNQAWLKGQTYLNPNPLLELN